MRGERAAATALLALTATLILTDVGLRRWAWDTQPLRAGLTFPPISGITAGGTIVNPVDARGAACLFVRYGSRACRYSSLDKEIAQRLESDLAATGCMSVLLAPAPSLMPEWPPLAGRTTLAYPSVSWSSRVPLRATPTTMVLDATGTVRWVKVGQLSDADREQALDMLRRTR